MAKLSSFFPKSHGKPRVDDWRVLSGIIFINRNGLRWRDAPAEYGPPMTTLQSLEAMERERHLCSDALGTGRPRWRNGHTDDRCNPSEDAPHRDKHAAKKGGRGRLTGRTKGGMNSKLHAVTDAVGRPLLTAG